MIIDEDPSSRIDISSPITAVVGRRARVGGYARGLRCHRPTSRVQPRRPSWCRSSARPVRVEPDDSRVEPGSLDTRNRPRLIRQSPVTTCTRSADRDVGISGRDAAADSDRIPTARLWRPGWPRSDRRNLTRPGGRARSCRCRGSTTWLARASAKSTSRTLASMSWPPVRWCCTSTWMCRRRLPARLALPVSPGPQPSAMLADLLVAPMRRASHDT